MQKKPTVFVGLSGGVDSSVAAWRLLQEGYDVVGVFIKVWQPDFLVCNWETERLDAMRVAAHLKIPFLTCDAEEAYRTQVGEYFIRAYQAGRTPNPDVLCNQHVKFGVFLEYALAHGADFVATGHYAQRHEMNSFFTLQRGVDSDKDQSYFLWTLREKQLKHILFPVGNSLKADIRMEATKAKLPVATKKDSQGVCFLGQIDIPEFLSHFVETKPGHVLNTEGVVIGRHQGALVYTIGQRHGFQIDSHDQTRQAHYVCAKDLTSNTITVSTQKPTLVEKSTVTLSDCNWIQAEPLVGTILNAQSRYRQKPFLVVYLGGGKIQLTDQTEAVAVGQSCVLYEGSTCVGGGIIS